MQILNTYHKQFFYVLSSLHTYVHIYKLSIKILKIFKKFKLAVVSAFEQSRYFTQGYDNLLVLTDHKPLVKLFEDRTLNKIANTLLFRLKQSSFLWQLKILH